jgi:heptosyltransferase-1
LIAGATDRSSIERLLIVRLSAMGDVIHTLPAAQVLRDAFPDAMIGWLVEERWEDLLCAPGTPRRGPRSAQRPLADWVHAVNLTGWRKTFFTAPTLERIVRVWNDVRSVRYNAVVDLQGAIRSAVLARWSGAPVIYGSTQPREAPASLWYTRKVVPTGTHVIEQNLSLAGAVTGKSVAAPPVEFPHDIAAESRIEKVLNDASIQDFALLNPGAGWGAKRWPAERYGLVARALAAHGIRSVVNYGPSEEDLAREVESASEGAAMPLKSTISELIALTRRAKLFVGGDTGPLHLAAALHVPVVAIFGPTDPARNGPYATRSIILRNPASPTTHARNPRPDEGMLEIRVDSVVDAACRLLDDVSLKRSARG